MKYALIFLTIALLSLQGLYLYLYPWNYWKIIIFLSINAGLVASYFLGFMHHRFLTEQEIQERTHNLAAINRMLKENEQRLIQGMRSAKETNLAKDAFLTNISHELRTPLNAIIGFNACLLMGMDGGVTKQQRESLKKIEKSSFHLLSLINNILDFAKIEAKGIELERKPYNLVDIISSCMEEIQPLASQKHLELQTVIPHPSIILLIDKGRIHQVLLNLLGNAVKFTEKGSIKVIVVEKSEEIEIHILDTGIGLSPEEIKKLFALFSQADSSITRKYGGTGLGLAISKRLVELHGGSLSVISKKREGSTFMIKLPLKREKND